MSKRALDTFFKPVTPPLKKPKPKLTSTPKSTTSRTLNDLEPDTHPSYPIPIPKLPTHLSESLETNLPARDPKTITNQPHLDLLYFQPYIPRRTANEHFTFLRAGLPFYRVQYSIKRGGLETRINTPRYTTCFGVDESARFMPRSEIDSIPTTSTSTLSPPTQDREKTQPQPPVKDLILTTAEPTTPPPRPPPKYTHTPRPIPTCLQPLLQAIQSATGTPYNFILVNYYASGEDSISFHSDDERFLGSNPTIASLSLGGEREFIMKHKSFSPSQPRSNGSGGGRGGRTGGGGDGGVGTEKATTGQIKMPLASGDMVVMRGPTQSNWLHSIPKRKGRNAGKIKGRINITFRRAMVPGGTNNYYTYNVGSGPVYRWDSKREEMVLQEESLG